jgi:hypothetical protein
MQQLTLPPDPNAEYIKVLPSVKGGIKCPQNRDLKCPFFSGKNVRWLRSTVPFRFGVHCPDLPAIPQYDGEKDSGRYPHRWYLDQFE